MEFGIYYLEFILLVFIFILGTAVGSFINVLEARLYKGEDIFKKPSHCDFCRKRLKWFDMVPILSWVWYGGRSRCCRRKLNWQYPIVEFITGVSFILIFLRTAIASLLHCFIAGKNIFLCSLTMEQLNNGTIVFFIIFALCFAIFLQDLKYQAIHQGLLNLLLITTFIFLIIINFSEFTNLRIYEFRSKFQIPDSKFFQNIAVAFISSLPFYLLYRLSKEKWLGEGDVWLVAWMGLFLGWPRVFWALYAGLIFGGAVSIMILFLHLKKMRDTISLGPFLLIGVIISLLM